MKQKKGNVSRGKILASAAVIAVIGLLFGVAMQGLLKDTLGLSQSNITICMIVFLMFVECLWLPFAIDSSKCMEYHETYLAYLPPYGHFKKLSLVLQILLSKEISDFYERLYWHEIDRVKFTFERKWGTWGYSRYTMQLYFLLKNKDVKLFTMNSKYGRLTYFCQSSS